MTQKRPSRRRVSRGQSPGERSGGRVEQESGPAAVNAADATLSATSASLAWANEGLNAKVLVLNKFYVAVRIVSARRAFGLLFRDIAEIIDVEDGRYSNYDFESWAEIAALRAEFEPQQHHDWVSTVSMQIPVPRIIRLLGRA